jgi:putative transposase
MKDTHTQVPLGDLCGLFGKSRAAWYKKKQTVCSKEADELIVVEHVKRLRKLMPRLGGRKLLTKLHEAGVRIGRDDLFSVLRANNLLVRRRRTTRVNTTQSSHWLRKYPNLIVGFQPKSPNELWVSDITYLQIDEGYAYLFLVTDAYSKLVLGYCVADNLHTSNAVSALRQALNQRPKYHDKILVHHSDRGLQYCSGSYVDLLKKHSIAISMTQDGDPLENAIAERVNGILKDEWFYDIAPQSFEETQKTVDRVIRIYNNHRPHLSLNMLTPKQAHTGQGILKRLWKNYYPTQASLRLET